MTNRRKELFPNVTDEQWNDWTWQVKNRIETLDQLKQYISLTEEEEEGVKKTLQTLRMAITPYYLSLIDPNDPYCPIRRQAIPTALHTICASKRICGEGAKLRCSTPDKLLCPAPMFISRFTPRCNCTRVPS